MGTQADGSPCILKRLIPGNFPRFGEPTLLLPLARIPKSFRGPTPRPSTKFDEVKAENGAHYNLTFTFRRRRQTDRQRVEFHKGRSRTSESAPCEAKGERGGV